MPAKKRSAPVERQRSRTTENENLETKETKRHHNKRTSPAAHKQLIYGISVLVVAIIAGVLWNTFDSSTDPRLLQFWSPICRVAQCARFVTPIRRTLQAARPIRVGEILAEIPRSLQIWDLDALRDEFVQTQLLFARHAQTGNRLPSGAFLAAYLALQYLQHIESKPNQTTIDVLRKNYFDLLPTWEELSDHPLTWSIEELVESLGRHSLSFGVAHAYKKMVDSEYQALALVSTPFASMINHTSYTLARLWVLTRSFSPGPLGIQNELVDNDERQLFTNHVATDFTKGCHVMVAILDLLNHHPAPNVAYSYNPDKRAFVITSERAIPSAFEIYDSYGRFSDSHLFAKFGFVNGDGSGYTQASITPFHRMLDYQIGDEFSYISDTTLPLIQGAQRQNLVRYLQYDDGYVDCIAGPDAGEAWTLKELKYQHLVRIAHNASRWVLTVGPRRPKSRPVESSQDIINEDPPDIDVRTTRIHINPLLETCRLLSLIHTDFNGQAISILQQNLETPNFVVERGTDALEYRAFMCIARLASSSLLNFGHRNVKDEMDVVAQLNRDAFGSRNWTSAHVRLGEMQTLQVVSGAGFGQIKQWQERLPDPIPDEYKLRGRACPKETITALGVQPDHTTRG